MLEYFNGRHNMRPNESDYISEQEFTRERAAPEDDSPDDSGDDATSEYMAGMSFDPKEARAAAAELEDEELADEDLPETAQVVSSGQPSSGSDRDSDSDTH
jgi:hypothetical protein